MKLLVAMLTVLSLLIGPSALAQETTFDDFHAMIAQRAAEHAADLKANRFSKIRDDYFSRYSRDSDAVAGDDEIEFDARWKIVLPEDASETGELMAGHLVTFFDEAMNLDLPLVRVPAGNDGESFSRVILLLESQGGDANVPESFAIRVENEIVAVAGRDPAGLRDGIVRLIDRIGMRQAPIVAKGKTVYRPRIRIRQGSHGSHRDTVLMGYNAILAGGGSLHGASLSDAIPELSAARRVEDALAGSYKTAREARRYGLKTYFHMGTQQKFAGDDPIFTAYPEIRGALTWKADGDYVLCTEHPLVKQYLSESVEGIFRGDPELDGLTVIIGGEGFYHCFMRPHGVEKGHTNCTRCEPLGADTVVSNLCNLLAASARKVNPEAEILAWPYSAGHVWSSDMAQTGFIKKLKPGVTVLTEIVKDEVVEKPEGIRKALWDYSIDMIGPGKKARQQIEACNAAGVSIRVLGMAEETFEASLLPHIPCMDRWVDRAEAMASNGIDSIYVFQMGPYDASSAAEINKHFWWDAAPEKEAFLQDFAARIGGAKAGPHLRDAWRYVSEAIDYSPEIGPYYQGPHYLGPMHPMCVDADAELPEVFYGYYLFYAELTADEAFKGRPTFITKARGDAPVFERYYRNMEERLKRAVDAIEKAQPLVPERCRLMFDSEANTIKWFYRTARTEANFYESCRIREQFEKLSNAENRESVSEEQVLRDFHRWQEVLRDEQRNAEAALPLLQADPRLDPYHRGDHSLSHSEDMLRAKLEILEQELEAVLPQIARDAGLDNL